MPGRAYRLLLLLTLLVGVGIGLLVPRVRGQRLLAPERATRPIAARADLDADEKETVDLFKAASPSVVYITNLGVRRDIFGMNATEVPQGTGSGFIWDSTGYVVTNFHVIQNAQAAEVTLADHSSWDAKLVGFEREKDLAVLKIDAPGERLRPLAIGTSNDLLVGQKVYAIGNPFGLDQTLTTGIISALDRQIPSSTGRAIRGVIQTDAAINPGNSGGPLLDSAGRLIGVNTAIYGETGANVGIGFAVPVDTVNQVVPQLISYGKVVRPGLGVAVARDQLAQRIGVKGVLIIEVTPDGGAAEAGLRPTRRDAVGRLVLGDVIVAVDGEPITNNDELAEQVERHRIGDRVKVTVDRGGRKVDAEVVLKPVS